MFNFLIVVTPILLAVSVIGLITSINKDKSKHMKFSSSELETANHLIYLNEPTGLHSEAPLAPLEILKKPYISNFGHYRDLVVCCSQFEKTLKNDVHSLSGNIQLSYEQVKQETKRHRLLLRFPYLITSKKVNQLRVLTQEWCYLDWHVRNIETPKKCEEQKTSHTLRSEPRDTRLPHEPFLLGEFIQNAREHPQSPPVHRKQKFKDMPVSANEINESITQLFKKINENKEQLDIEQQHRFETLHKDHDMLFHVYRNTETTEEHRIDALLSEGLTEILNRTNEFYASLVKKAEFKMERQVEVIKSR